MKKAPNGFGTLASTRRFPPTNGIACATPSRPSTRRRSGRATTGQRGGSETWRVTWGSRGQTSPYSNSCCATRHIRPSRAWPTTSWIGASSPVATIQSVPFRTGLSPTRWACPWGLCGAAWPQTPHWCDRASCRSITTATSTCWTASCGSPMHLETAARTFSNCCSTRHRQRNSSGRTTTMWQPAAITSSG